MSDGETFQVGSGRFQIKVGWKTAGSMVMILFAVIWSWFSVKADTSAAKHDIEELKQINVIRDKRDADINQSLQRVTDRFEMFYQEYRKDMNTYIREPADRR